MKRFQQNKREKLKEKCLVYLNGKKCYFCGVQHLPMCCYDFHHNKGGKEKEISQMIVKNEKWEVLKKELDKCIILCSNCHRIKHHFH